MLRPYANVEEALVGIEEYLKELVQHPAINKLPSQVKVGTNSRYVRRHACCKKHHSRVRGDSWEIIFNLPVLKCNLTNTYELDMLCRHEIAHIPCPNHGLRFKVVCELLGIPGDKLVRSRKSSGLNQAKATHVWKCLRCGDTKNTQREPNLKLKSCDWCGHHYVDDYHKDRARTMIMMTVEEAKEYKGSKSYKGFQTISNYYKLPWKLFAEYVRDGGEFSPLAWYESMQKLATEHYPAYTPQVASANKSQE